MKIEIELSEIEALRRRITELEDDMEERKDQLKKLMEDRDQGQLKIKAIQLAEAVFKRSIKMVFKKLGFEEDDQWGYSVSRFAEFERWFGKQWYDSPDIYVDLGAEVTNKFKRAFLNLGVISPAEKKDENPLEPPE